MKKYFPLEEDELMPLVSLVGLEEKSLGLFLQICTVQHARYPDIQVKILATYPTLHTKTHQRGLRWLRPDKQFGTNLIREICQVDLGKCCFAK